MIFHVAVSPSTLNIDGNTYYSSYFEVGMKSKFTPYMSNIWDEDAWLNVEVHRTNRYRYHSSSKFNGKEPINETLEEMSKIFLHNYNSPEKGYAFDFIISFNQCLKDKDRATEIRRVLHFIEIMKSSNFEPEVLTLRYIKSNLTMMDKLLIPTCNLNTAIQSVIYFLR